MLNLANILVGGLNTLEHLFNEIHAVFIIQRNK